MLIKEIAGPNNIETGIIEEQCNQLELFKDIAQKPEKLEEAKIILILQISQYYKVAL